jgi:flagellar hook-associated protein 3 FlgL
MTERITTQMQSSLMLANINNDLAALDRTQNELSTGMQITQPSDNPYGAALSMQLSGQLSAMNSYASNVTDGTAWANTAGTALDSIQQAVQSARTLVVEAGNGSLGASGDTSIAAQIGQLITDVKQASSAQYNGNYVFSGTATDAAPYSDATGDAYQGDQGSILRAIGPGGSPIAVNVQLSTVLGQGQDANGGSGDGLLLNTLETIQSDVQSGTVTNSDDLSKLDTNISALEGLQGNVGALQDRLQMASARITGFQTTDQIQLANTEDVDMASASISYATEQAGYSAALQTGAQIIQTSLLTFLHS